MCFVVIASHRMDLHLPKEHAIENNRFGLEKLLFNFYNFFDTAEKSGTNHVQVLHIC